MSEAQELVTAQQAAERRMAAENGPATLPATEETDAASLMRAIERMATDPRVDADKLNKLLDVKERWDREEARKAFHAALARFKVDPPRIVKNADVEYGRTKYSHATLDEVVYKIAPALGREGLSFAHDVRQADGVIAVTCTLTHERGHSESVTLTGLPDDSGQKNAIQQIASTVTYLRRYTLEAITGLAAEGDDDDGRGFSQSALIGASEFAFLNAEIAEIGDALDLPKFLEYLGVESIEELRAADFGKAKTALEAKRRKLAEETAPAEDAEPEPHEVLIP